MTYDKVPPTDTLVASMRTQMHYDAANYIGAGLIKVASVRITIEFHSGDVITVEHKQEPYP